MRSIPLKSRLFRFFRNRTYTFILLWSIIAACALTGCGQPASSASPEALSAPPKAAPTASVPSVTPTPDPNATFVNITVADHVVYSVSQQVSALRVDDGTLLWQTRMEGVVEDQPIVTDGILYVNSFVGQNGPAYLTAFRTSDGQQLWRYRADSYIFTPLVQDGVVYLSEQQAGVTALNASTGQRLWHVAGATDQKVTLDNGTLFFSRNANDLDPGISALRASDGRVLWRISLPASTGLTLSSGVVYACCTLGKLSAFRASDGHALWSQALDASFMQQLQQVNEKIYVTTTKILLPTPAATTQTGTRPSLLMAANRLFAPIQHSTPTLRAHATLPHKGGISTLYALNAQNGTLLWQRQIGQGNDNFVNNFYLEQGIFYIATINVGNNNTSTLSALREDDGKTLWTRNFDGSVDGMDITDGTIYISTATNTSMATAIRMQDGLPLWHTPIEANVFDAPIVSDTTLILGTSNNMLLALRTSSGARLWQKTFSA